MANEIHDQPQPILADHPGTPGLINRLQDETTKSRSWLAEGVHDTVGLVWHDDSKTRQTVEQSTTEFLKAVPLFLGGKRGYYASAALYALDQMKTDHQGLSLVTDAVAGATKGAATKGVFNAFGRMDWNPALKGVAIGSTTRMVDSLLTPDNFDNNGHFDLVGGLGTSIKTAYSLPSLVADAATFGIAHGVTKGFTKFGDAVTAGSFGTSALAQTIMTGASFGFTSGVVAETQRQYMSMNNFDVSKFDFGKILSEGGRETLIMGAAGGVGHGMTAAADLPQPVRKEITTAQAVDTVTSLPGKFSDVVGSSLEKLRTSGRLMFGGQDRALGLALATDGGGDVGHGGGHEGHDGPGPVDPKIVSDETLAKIDKALGDAREPGRTATETAGGPKDTTDTTGTPDPARASETGTPADRTATPDAAPEAASEAEELTVFHPFKGQEKAFTRAAELLGAAAKARENASNLREAAGNDRAEAAYHENVTPQELEFLLFAAEYPKDLAAKYTRQSVIDKHADRMKELMKQVSETLTDVSGDAAKAIYDTAYEHHMNVPDHVQPDVAHGFKLLTFIAAARADLRKPDLPAAEKTETEEYLRNDMDALRLFTRGNGAELGTWMRMLAAKTGDRGLLDIVNNEYAPEKIPALAPPELEKPYLQNAAMLINAESIGNQLKTMEKNIDALETGKDQYAAKVRELGQQVQALKDFAKTEEGQKLEPYMVAFAENFFMQKYKGNRTAQYLEQTAGNPNRKLDKDVQEFADQYYADKYKGVSLANYLEHVIYHPTDAQVEVDSKTGKQITVRPESLAETTALIDGAKKASYYTPPESTGKRRKAAAEPDRDTKEDAVLAARQEFTDSVRKASPYSQNKMLQYGERSGDSYLYAIMRDAVMDRPAPKVEGNDAVSMLLRYANDTDNVTRENLDVYARTIASGLNVGQNVRSAFETIDPGMIRSSLAAEIIDSNLASRRHPFAEPVRSLGDSFPRYNPYGEEPAVNGLVMSEAKKAEAERVVEDGHEPGIRFKDQTETQLLDAMFSSPNLSEQAGAAAEETRRLAAGKVSNDGLDQLVSWLYADRSDGVEGPRLNTMVLANKEMLANPELRKALEADPDHPGSFTREDFMRYMTAPETRLPNFPKWLHDFVASSEADKPLHFKILNSIKSKFVLGNENKPGFKDEFKAIQDLIAKDSGGKKKFRDESPEPRETASGRLKSLNTLLNAPMAEAVPKLMELGSQDATTMGDVVERLDRWATVPEIHDLMYHTLPQARNVYTLDLMLRGIEDANMSADRHAAVELAQAAVAQMMPADPAGIAAVEKIMTRLITDAPDKIKLPEPPREERGRGDDRKGGRDRDRDRDKDKDRKIPSNPWYPKPAGPEPEPEPKPEPEPEPKGGSDDPRRGGDETEHDGSRGGLDADADAAEMARLLGGGDTESSRDVGKIEAEDLPDESGPKPPAPADDAEREVPENNAQRRDGDESETDGQTAAPGNGALNGTGTGTETGTGTGASDSTGDLGREGSRDDAAGPKQSEANSSSPALAEPPTVAGWVPEEPISAQDLQKILSDFDKDALLSASHPEEPQAMQELEDRSATAIEKAAEAGQEVLNLGSEYKEVFDMIAERGATDKRALYKMLKATNQEDQLDDIMSFLKDAKLIEPYGDSQWKLTDVGQEIKLPGRAEAVDALDKVNDEGLAVLQRLRTIEGGMDKEMLELYFADPSEPEYKNLPDDQRREHERAWQTQVSELTEKGLANLQDAGLVIQKGNRYKLSQTGKTAYAVERDTIAHYRSGTWKP